MLSLGGFFLALFLGDVILGWGQSQPVGMTDCEEMSERSFRTLSCISTSNISESIKNMFKPLPDPYYFMNDMFKKISKAERPYIADHWKQWQELLHTVSLTAGIFIKSQSFDLSNLYQVYGQHHKTSYTYELSQSPSQRTTEMSYTDVHLELTPSIHVTIQVSQKKALDRLEK